ncbi:uncharacterized protein LOC113397500 isoform X1 [Vanessa tameamea]|uniref:Uncharacterized protein LOC113397500 isoform X1 n=1 Tax=Vanessa tameamea TaxID=334116 RepID=A0A8B8I6C8_VANTA|nr:uncharacterized protein LOC113397500 isoform X1 [Vanessa tameamea]
MARIFFLFVFVVAVNGFRHHPKFPKADESDLIKKVACNSTLEQRRNEFIEKSRCGEPKEVFQELKLQSSYLQVSPSWVWVKRCVGLCDLEAPGSQCVATKTRIEPIPVRIYNLKTNKETCSTYSLEVHESCSCCTSSSSDCASPRVYNPRKCSCQCPNMEERRNCLKKRNQNMKWNRSKCICEKKRTLW